MAEEGTPPPPDKGAPPPPDDDKVDYKAKYEQQVEHSRKWEDRAKTNRKAAEDAEKLARANMTEQEQALAAARDEGTAEATKKLGSRLVDAEVKVLATGRPIADIDALLEGIDRSRFLTDDAEPDVKVIKAWLDRVAPFPDDEGEPGGPKPHPTLAQGSRGAGGGDPKKAMNAFIRNRRNG